MDQALPMSATDLLSLIRARVRMLRRNTPDIDDLVADCAAHILDRYARGKWDGTHSFSLWVSLHVTSRLIDLDRRATTRRRYEEASPVAIDRLGCEAAQHDARATVLDALGRLGYGEAAAVCLTSGIDCPQMTLDEAAAVLGRCPSRVRHLRRTGFRLLRETMRRSTAPSPAATRR